MYIPQEGLYFRLVSTNTKYKLFSRTGALPEFWHFNGPQYDDQVFTLIYGTSSNSHPGQYAIKGVLSERVLYSRENDPRVGNIAGDGEFPDK